MEFKLLIDEYAQGPQRLRDSLAGLTPAQIDAVPVPGRWSTRQVVCHIADFEPILADRMKRVIAEHEPMLLAGDPDEFAAALAYAQRDVENELRLIDAVRCQMATILRQLAPEDFGRKGTHSQEGPLTLETLVRRATRHIFHHVKFIEEKRAALSAFY